MGRPPVRAISTAMACPIPPVAPVTRIVWSVGTVFRSFSHHDMRVSEASECLATAVSRRTVRQRADPARVRNRPTEYHRERQLDRSHARLITASYGDARCNVSRRTLALLRLEPFDDLLRCIRGLEIGRVEHEQVFGFVSHQRPITLVPRARIVGIARFAFGISSR